MALILKGGAVFLHVPKTGGNWITEVLRKSGLVDRAVGHKRATMDRLLAATELLACGHSAASVHHEAK